MIRARIPPDRHLTALFTMQALLSAAQSTVRSVVARSMSQASRRGARDFATRLKSGLQLSLKPCSLNLRPLARLTRLRERLRIVLGWKRSASCIFVFHVRASGLRGRGFSKWVENKSTVGRVRPFRAPCLTVAPFPSPSSFFDFHLGTRNPPCRSGFRSSRPWTSASGMECSRCWEAYAIRQKQSLSLCQSLSIVRFP